MIYLVTGFMRSGTSMLMQVCEAGGLSVVRSEARDRMNIAHSDRHYAPNPSSLYEPDAKDMQTLGFPRQYDGHALKLVAPFLRNLAVHDYSVVCMRRDPEEIRQSYEGAFGVRLSVPRIEQQIDEALLTLRNRRDVREVIELSYSDVITSPLATLSRVPWPWDLTQAVSVINPTQYRFRREQLVEGA